MTFRHPLATPGYHQNLHQKPMRKLRICITSASIGIIATLSTPVYAGSLGALLGAAGGAALGSSIGKGKGNVAAIAVGTVLGAGLGSNIEDTPPHTRYIRSVSYEPAYGYPHNREYYHHHYNRYHEHHPYYHSYYAYPHSSYTSYWINPAPASVVTETVYPAVTPPPSTIQCREFTQTIRVGGRIQESYGTACLQPDGSWQMQP